MDGILNYWFIEYFIVWCNFCKDNKVLIYLFVYFNVNNVLW